MCVLLTYPDYPIYKLICSLLLIEYVASTASNNDVDNAIQRKDKTALPIPVSYTMMHFPCLY